IAFADFMSAHSILVIVGFIGLVGGFIAFLRTATGRRGLHWFLLHMPLVNPVVKKINMARFARILGSLMKSGIAVVQGLQVTSDAIENVYYKEVIAKTAESVKLGKPLTEALAQHDKLFPFIV